MIFAVNGVGSKLFLQLLMVFNKYFHNGIRWSFNTEKEIVLFFVRLSGSLMIEFNPMFPNLLYISSSLSQLISSSKRHLPLQQRKSVLVSILFLNFSLLPFFCVPSPSFKTQLKALWIHWSSGRMEKAGSFYRMAPPPLWKILYIHKSKVNYMGHCHQQLSSGFSFYKHVADLNSSICPHHPLSHLIKCWIEAFRGDILAFFFSILEGNCSIFIISYISCRFVGLLSDRGGFFLFLVFWVLNLELGVLNFVRCFSSIFWVII